MASGSAKLDLSPGQSVPLGLTLVIDPSPSRSQPPITVELAPGVPLDMVWIEPGVFTMGSPLDEQGRNDDEGPQREVRLTQGVLPESVRSHPAPVDGSDRRAAVESLR